MKIIRAILCCLAAGVMMLPLSWISVSASGNQTIYSSPYVDFAPDGMAWTTNAGETNIVNYEDGIKVETHIPSLVRALELGEHYYLYNRTGSIPIGWWEVTDMDVTCIHNSYPTVKDYHGIDYVRNLCGAPHHSGWNAYCADCNQKIDGSSIYMSMEAAESMDYFEIREDLDYYYLCPFCRNLEQGVSFDGHECRAVSWNQYKVVYYANVSPTERYGGYMADSLHMYNNASEYEGNIVTPITHLTKNSFHRVGYEFVEWNTEPDGSGICFQDGAEIFNLSRADWNDGSTWVESDKGVVRLYAQWRRCESTLRIDPAGGFYKGLSAVTTVKKGYGENYIIPTSALEAPEGVKVSFDARGGKNVDAITSTRRFTEWVMQQPFKGRMKENIYYFTGPDGNTDTLTASYAFDAITLPEAVKTGSSFGGWYYDKECTQPAGGAGDTIIPTKNMTLYASWVDLKLFSQDNYIANNKKGAVDLSWSQSDNKNKTYKVYQSRDNLTWKLITSATDMENKTEVFQNFIYTGSTKKYIVPYSGIYTLTAYGAQGGNYGSYRGGLGGSAKAVVWLKKGETLTYTIGGQSGYCNGGSGSVYGNGGGSTTIMSDRQGTLLVAGGGGGASESGNGGAGGSSVSLRGDKKSNGVAGQTGGGGGYVGGNAGEYIVHTHTEACYKTEDLSYSLFDSAWMTTYWNQRPRPIHSGDNGITSTHPQSNIHSMGIKDFLSTKVIGTGGHTKNGGIITHHLLGTYNDTEPVCGYIPTEGNKNVLIDFKIDLEAGGNDRSYIDQSGSYLAVYDQNKTCIYSSKLVPYTIHQYEYNKDTGATQLQTSTINTTGIKGVVRSFRPHKNWTSNGQWKGVAQTELISATINVPLSEKTTHIYIDFKASVPNADAWFGSEITSVKFVGGEEKYTICGYEEGQVISCKPAYGGSNYVNSGAAYDSFETAGVQKGNGAFSITSEEVGYLDVLSLDNVIATDFATPDKISEQTVIKEPIDDTYIRIAWGEPEDNGTEYYHMAESFLVGSTELLCRSNVTKNTLRTGIQGYYFLEDNKANTVVSAVNATFSEEKSRIVSVGAETKYLHVAAVDWAGNISGTLHIRVDAKEMEWKLYTKQLSVEEGDNVYMAKTDKTWYVRADQKTPFTLYYEAYMDGTATEKYQLNYIIYESVMDGIVGRNIVYSPSVSVQTEGFRTDAENLSHSTQGQTMFIQYPYSYTVRTKGNRNLSGVQSYLLSCEAAGKRITVLPIAGVSDEGEIVYSEYESDKQNAITLIGDGEAPCIYGLELLENRELINRNDTPILLTITASDDLSGVKEFYVEIRNTNNGNCKTYTPETDGSIKIEITQDEPIFSGDFEVKVYAADWVGNEKEMMFQTTEFALQTQLERMLSPHEPVFACGESGVLQITTYGYADKIEVEFPEELTSLNPQLNCVFDYSEGGSYVQKERIQFMIPLNAPANESYIITVRAYKGDKQLEDYPSFSTIAVQGSILDNVRTRLR